MAEGINIKVLPQANSIAGNDRILLDKNVAGTQVILFSAVIVDGSQVTFYNDFLSLSADANQTKTILNNVSTNLINLSAYTYSANLLLTTNLNTISGDVETLKTDSNTISGDVKALKIDTVSLSSNTTTFISGGISPSGSIVPSKVGILYFSEDTKDYFVSVDNANVNDWRRILTVDY